MALMRLYFTTCHAGVLFLGARDGKTVAPGIFNFRSRKKVKNQEFKKCGHVPIFSPLILNYFTVAMVWGTVS